MSLTSLLALAGAAFLAAGADLAAAAGLVAGLRDGAADFWGLRVIFASGTSKGLEFPIPFKTAPLISGPATGELARGERR